MSDNGTCQARPVSLRVTDLLALCPIPYPLSFLAAHASEREAAAGRDGRKVCLRYGEESDRNRSLAEALRSSRVHMPSRIRRQEASSPIAHRTKWPLGWAVKLAVLRRVSVCHVSDAVGRPPKNNVQRCLSSIRWPFTWEPGHVSEYSMKMKILRHPFIIILNCPLGLQCHRILVSANVIGCSLVPYQPS